MIAQTGTFTVDGAAVAYSVEGAGPSNVVLLHGFAAHRHWWDTVVPYLLASCRVLRIDFTGHGDSAHRDTYSLDTWATEVLAVQQEVLGSGPFLLVAHSLGGRVAIAATRHPGNTIAELILFDTLFPEPEHFSVPSTWKATRRTYDSRDAALARFRLVPPQPLDEQSVRDLAEHSVRSVSDGWTWKHDHRLNPGDVGVVPLDPVDVPLTIAYGEHSSIVDERAAGRAAALTGDLATVVMIPDTHHHLLLESPAAVADVILSHLPHPTKEQ